MAFTRLQPACFVLLLVVLSIAAGATTPPTPATWACVQQQRVHRLEHLLVSLVHETSDLGAALHLPRISTTTADDLLACAAREPHTSVAAAASTAHTRQLRQLAASVTDYEATPGRQLRRTTVSNIRINDPDGSYQMVSNIYSTSTPLITPEAANNVASVAPRLVATSNALLGSLDVQPAGPPVLPTAAALVTAAAGNRDSQQPLPLQPSLRIIGGVAAPTDRKYVCSLRTVTSDGSDFLYCGCSLIAPRVALTAAHCVQDLRTPWVEIGRYYQHRPNDTTVNDYDRIRCSTSVIHPDWDNSNARNDIALCFLDAPSRFAPVQLADTANTKITTGQPLSVMGWGATSEGGSQSESLLIVDVEATDTADCNDVYGNQINGATQLCAGVPEGGKDACQGDSGGPLVIRDSTGSSGTAADDVQVGIVSFGIGCARPNLPGVYTDVRAYRQWVAQQLLGRGLEYGPVTDGYTAGVQVTSQAAACACTQNATSGSAELPSALSGCKQHGLSTGDTDFYCYTQGGSSCAVATASNTYPGAAWIDCTPEAAATGGPVPAPAPPQRPPAPAPAPSQQRPPEASVASLLGSLFAQFLTAPRNGTNITTLFAGNGTAARNRTAAIATRAAALLSRRTALPAPRD